MADPSPMKVSDQVRAIGVGMLGYAFMGKAHANAYRTLAYMTWPPPLSPELVLIAGRDQGAVVEAATRYGFAEAVTNWEAIVSDPRVGLFDNCGPNGLHAEPTLAAARAGTHVLCEKPLGRDALESFEVWQGVAAAGVVHMCGFNYRFVPAVRLAREPRAPEPARARSNIQTDGHVGPHGADFEDGYRAAEVCDAVIRSSRSGHREAVSYRG